MADDGHMRAGASVGRTGFTVDPRHDDEIGRGFIGEAMAARDG